MDFFRSLYSKAIGLNFAHILVLGLVVKAIVSDISISTFLISIPVLAFEGYKLYIKSKQPDPIAIDAEIRKELDNIKAKVNAGAFEKNIVPVAQPKRYF